MGLQPHIARGVVGIGYKITGSLSGGTFNRKGSFTQMQNVYCNQHIGDVF